MRKNYDKKETIQNKEIKNDYKNEINLVYFAKSKGRYSIFGQYFVKNNKNNIELL